MSINGFVGLMLLALSTTGCAVMGLSRFSADPIDVKVVDADSGAPLTGVVGVAIWPLNKGGLTGDSLPCGTAGVEESVTGEDGLLTYDAAAAFRRDAVLGAVPAPGAA